MYECFNCERTFEEPVIINNETVCPYCYSSDNNCDIEVEEGEENE